MILELPFPPRVEVLQTHPQVIPEFLLANEQTHICRYNDINLDRKLACDAPYWGYGMITHRDRDRHRFVYRALTEIQRSRTKGDNRIRHDGFELKPHCSSLGCYFHRHRNRYRTHRQHSTGSNLIFGDLCWSSRSDLLCRAVPIEIFLMQLALEKQIN